MHPTKCALKLFVEEKEAAEKGKRKRKEGPMVVPDEVFPRLPSVA